MFLNPIKIGKSELPTFIMDKCRFAPSEPTFIEAQIAGRARLSPWSMRLANLGAVDKTTVAL